MNYASFWRRFIGFLIDFIIVMPISWAIYKSTVGQTIILSQMLYMFFEGTYYVLFWVLKSATPGMMIMRIRMESINNSLTVGRALIRYIGTYITAFSLGLGAIWMLWDKKSQTWQDKMAKTIVIKV